MSTIPAFIRERAAAWPDATALRVPEKGGRRSIAYGEFLADVNRFSRGLADAGVRPGDRVYLLADNSPRWIVADLGILAAGAVSVPRGADTGPEESAYILRHSGATAVVAGTPKLLDALPATDREIGVRVVIDGESSGAIAFPDVLARGEGAPEPAPGGDLATIVYTSGTTGTPKGVSLTHANILHNVRVLPPLLAVGPGDLFVSVLPSWHMFERTVEYIVLASGATLSYSGIRTIRQDLVEEKPTFLAGVPRLFETFESAALARIEKQKPVARAVARFLLRRTLKWSACRLRLAHRWQDPQGEVRRSRLLDHVGRAVGAPLGLLGRRVLGRAVRDGLGGRMRGAVSGGGMLSPHLDRFLDAMGIPILVGYGLTETSPVAALRRFEDNVLGTIGRAVPETEIRIVDEAGEPVPEGRTGEIEVRGPQVMAGYHDDPDSSRAVLRPEGWLRTGDLGRLTAKGDLVFTGRRKETIVLAGGENIEPTPIENRILESPYVRQVMVVGQDRKTLAALLVPDRDAAAREAGVRRTTVEDLLRSEVLRLVCRRTGFKPRETIGRIAVVEREFNVDDGTLTRTLKLRRNAIIEQYRSLIDSLYE